MFSQSGLPWHEYRIHPNLRFSGLQADQREVILDCGVYFVLFPVIDPAIPLRSELIRAVIPGLPLLEKHHHR